MGTMKVWEGETLYDKHIEIEPVFDPDSAEFYKLIPETNDLLASVQHEIDNAIEQLNSLRNMLGIFNEEGLRTILININNARDRITYAPIEGR